MKGIGKLISTKSRELIFSLVCGLAYYIVITGFIINNTQTGGLLLSFFFLPAIICGAALLLIKTIRKLKDEEQFGKINAIIYAHIVLFAVSLFFLAEIIMSI